VARIVVRSSVLLVASLVSLVSCGSDPKTPGPTGPTCSDVVKNGAESDVDCGGACAACATGKSCIEGSDCLSGRCTNLVCTDAECDDPSACAGTDTECQTRTCVGGVCGLSYATQGTAVTAQTVGDCQKVVCNGAGGTESVDDDLDLPVDGEVCTDDVCTVGVPSNPAVDANTDCGTDLVCDGDGHCVGCVDADTCPGTDTECQTRTCIDNTCGMSYGDNTVVVADQTAGDCQKVVCDSAGGTESIADNTDLPVDDNSCTKDLCTVGVPSNPAEDLSFDCGSPLYCDGAGHCVECMDYTECTGTDNECGHRTCTDGVCGMAFVPDGDPATAQTTGDCHTVICNGAGVGTNTIVGNDPIVDGDPCTQDLCTTGTPSNPLENPGFPCGNGVCDATGACVDCLVAGDCAQPVTECAMVDCLPDNTCDYIFKADGLPTLVQHAGDCHETQCTGGDATKQVVDDADKPVDLNPCTTDVCQAGAPSNPPLAEGTTCGDSAACNAAADCTITFMVLRVGDGSASLTSAATPVFVEERWVDGTLLTLAGNPMALPTTASGGGQMLTLGGSTDSEGGLTRSSDKNYVTLAGYAASVGTAAVANTTAAAVNRVVGRINSSYQVDTSTRIDAGFNGASGNVRSAVSVDGSAFWVSGVGASLSGGVHYVVYGSTGASVDLYSSSSATPNNTRWCQIFADQLYCDAASATFQGVFTVGTGLPTTAAQATTMLPGLPTATGPGPYGFVFFDTDVTAGPDVLYIADDRAAASGGGVQKWTLVAGTWTLGPTFATGTATSVRGLAGIQTSLGVLLFVAGQSRIVEILDIGTANPTATDVAINASNTAFRGVSLSPRHL